VIASAQELRVDVIDALKQYISTGDTDAELKSRLIDNLGMTSEDADRYLTQAHADLEAEQKQTLKTSALFALDFGLHVFALGERVKEPDSEESPNGFRSSTNDREKVNYIWTRKPKANIGVDCGSSDVCVFDFDHKESIPSWVETFKTLKVQTAKGVHVYTRGARPSKRMYDETGNHIGEIKSTGGYVIWDKSVHPSGALYQIIDNSPIAPTPDDRVAELTKHAAKIDVDVSPNGAKIPYHQHDDTLARIAGKLRNIGMEEEATYNALVEVCEKRCENYGGDYKEMCRKIAHSICRYPVVNRDIEFLQKPSVDAAAQPDWGVPEPIDSELSPVEPFDAEFLPDGIKAWVKDVSERMAVPMDFAGICALAVLAGVTGRRAFVYPKANDKEWKESICLSGAVVAASGKIKTPTWKTFINPVIEKESDWRKVHQVLMKKYETEIENWNEDSGAPEPVKPECQRLMLNDATPEKMHDVMRTNPTGLFYYRDELSSWVAELDKEGREVQRGLFLAAMNGNDAYSVDRIGREGGFALMCATVFGGFQPELLKAFLNDSVNIDDGTIPRFPLLVWPDEIELPIIDRLADNYAKTQFRNIVYILAEMPPESISLHFDQEAQKLFDDWFVELNKKIRKSENSGMCSHLAKYKGALPKIAGLFQLIDLLDAAGRLAVTGVNLDTGEKTINPVVTVLSGHHRIDKAHLQKAVRFLQYLESHMIRVYGCIQDPIKKAETALAKRMKERDLQNTFSIRDVKRKCWRGLSKPEFVEFALENLEDKKWVRQTLIPAGPQGGRPTVRWEVNPVLSQ